MHVGKMWKLVRLVPFVEYNLPEHIFVPAGHRWKALGLKFIPNISKSIIGVL